MVLTSIIGEKREAMEAAEEMMNLSRPLPKGLGKGVGAQSTGMDHPV